MRPHSLLLAAVIGSMNLEGNSTPQAKNTYTECMDKSGGVTSSMLECEAAEAKLEDGRLNNAFKALSSKLKPSRKARLKSLQQLWIKFRDANCDFYQSPDGGTADVLARSNCILVMTRERANELEKLIP